MFTTFVSARRVCRLVYRLCVLYYRLQALTLYIFLYCTVYTIGITNHAYIVACTLYIRTLYVLNRNTARSCFGPIPFYLNRLFLSFQNVKICEETSRRVERQ